MIKQFYYKQFNLASYTVCTSIKNSYLKNIVSTGLSSLLNNNKMKLNYG